MAKWEIRRALRWGSEHIRFVGSENMARAYAAGDIVANGDKGRIEYVDQEKRILYYDIHEELT